MKNTARFVMCPLAVGNRGTGRRWERILFSLSLSLSFFFLGGWGGREEGRLVNTSLCADRHFYTITFLFSMLGISVA